MVSARVTKRTSFSRPPQPEHFSTSIATSEVQTSVLPRFNNGQIWNAWIDYNAETSVLEVRVAPAPQPRPVAPTLSHSVDIPAVMGQPQGFFGFTSGVGAATNTHDLRSWTLSFDNPILAGRFESPAGTFSSLTQNLDSSFLLRSKDGTERRFNAQGLLTAIADRNANTTTYAYGPANELETITDPAGLPRRALRSRIAAAHRRPAAALDRE